MSMKVRLFLLYYSPRLVSYANVLSFQLHRCLQDRELSIQVSILW